MDKLLSGFCDTVSDQNMPNTRADVTATVSKSSAPTGPS